MFFFFDRKSTLCNGETKFLLIFGQETTLNVVLCNFIMYLPHNKNETVLLKRLCNLYLTLIFDKTCPFKKLIQWITQNVFQKNELLTYFVLSAQCNTYLQLCSFLMLRYTERPFIKDVTNQEGVGVCPKMILLIQSNLVKVMMTSCMDVPVQC